MECDDDNGLFYVHESTDTECACTNLSAWGVCIRMTLTMTHKKLRRWKNSDEECLVFETSNCNATFSSRCSLTNSALQPPCGHSGFCECVALASGRLPLSVGTLGISSACGRPSLITMFVGAVASPLAGARPTVNEEESMVEHI